MGTYCRYQSTFESASSLVTSTNPQTSHKTEKSGSVPFKGQSWDFSRWKCTRVFPNNQIWWRTKRGRFTVNPTDGDSWRTLSHTRRTQKLLPQILTVGSRSKKENLTHALPLTSVNPIWNGLTHKHTHTHKTLFSKSPTYFFPHPFLSPSAAP